MDLSQKHTEDAARMAEIYPVLYAFENSMREWIDGHLTAAYGSKWHEDPKIVTTGMRERVARNRDAEDRSRYHSRRNAPFIYYTDLGDLGSQQVPVPTEVLAARPALARYEGRKVAFGIRPEHVREPGGAAAGAPSLAGTVVVTEALGSERLVHVEVPATPVVSEEVLEVMGDADVALAEDLETDARERRAVVLARFDASLRPQPGDRVELRLAADKAHFFDLATGLAIYA